MFSKILNSDLVSKLILVLVSLLPIFYLPLVVSSINYSKFIFIYILTLVSSLIFFYGKFTSKDSKIRINTISVGIILVLISYTISTLFSKNFSVSFWGRDFTQDSWITVFLLFTTTLVISSVFKKTNILNVIWLTLITSGIASLVKIAYLVVPSLPSLGLFYSPLNNFIGKINDLALFAVVGIIIGLIALNQVRLSSKFKAIICLIITLNLTVVLLVNFYLSLYILAAFGIVYSVYKISITKTFNLYEPLFLIVLISIAGIIWGSTLNNKVVSIFNLNYLEVRPSIEGTMIVNKGSLNENLLIGTGPATFEIQWPIYKPIEVLQSEFWNLDFRYGHGIIMSFISTTGILGTFLWLFFILSVLFFSIKGILLKTKDSETKFIINTVSFLNIVMWIVAAFYIPTTVIFSFAFIFTGLLIAILVDQNVIKNKEINISELLAKSFYALMLVIVLILIIGITLRFISHTYFQRSVNEISTSGDINRVKYLVEKSVQYNKTDVNFRSLAKSNAAILFQKISNKEELNAEEFSTDIANIVKDYENAVNYDRNNYYNYIDFGNFYSDLVSINFSKEESYSAALNLYNRASELKPNNPFIDLSKARLEFINGDTNKSKELLISVIKLKPDYFDAYASLSQVQLESNDNKEAINTINEYLKLFPNNIDAMYRLAIIYVQIEEYESAIAQFEAIYQLQPREEIKKWIEDLVLKVNSVPIELPVEDFDVIE
jgi:putative inorganic carbon (HCO3(-)) transporter